MFSFLTEILEKYAIDCFGVIPLSECKVTKPYLLEREGIADGSAVILAVPYFTKACLAPNRNLSAYAVPRNYHAFFEMLYAELLPKLRERFPTYRFAGFSDHSPIAEVEAASRAGLGVIGKNHLLLTQKYSSYVFLGEIITDMPTDRTATEVTYCEGCGACERLCPASECGGCLSALTQKKGVLSEQERVLIKHFGSVWGCDICQEVCPHTKKAIKSESIFTPIPYFNEQTVAHLSLAVLDAFTPEEFAERAFSWRGRETVQRNLKIMEGSETEGDEPC